MASFKAADGTDLYEELWPAEGEARGALVLVHGYGEHIGRYNEAARAWAKQGWQVRGADLRGHGRSGGVRGFCSRFDEYLSDLGALVARARTDSASGRPLFLLGHSFGGLIATSFAIGHSRELTGLVLSSPYFKLKLEVPKAKVVAGRLMSRIYPKLALPSGLKGEDVARYAEIARAYDADPLNNKNATARWFTEASAAQESAYARAGELTLPCLFLHGGSDRVADPRRTEELFKKVSSSDKTLEILPGQFHEILNEPKETREKTIARIGEWLSSHAEGASKLRAGGS